MGLVKVEILHYIALHTYHWWSICLQLTIGIGQNWHWTTLIQECESLVLYTLSRNKVSMLMFTNALSCSDINLQISCSRLGLGGQRCSLLCISWLYKIASKFHISNSSSKNTFLKILWIPNFQKKKKKSQSSCNYPTM